ncbi:peptidase M56 BlaR1 [Paenibacillus xylanexedens]|uniref:peptidase M56 BlaR1 n=1 Tax=Paenibacillus xylanexedens TaxID=528191 RepID=UPI003D0827B9
MNLKRLLVATLTATATIIVISASVFGDKSNDSFEPNTAQEAQELYPVNESGQTYGKSLDPLVIPDLILAEGTDGKTGYVLSSDLVGTDPATPEDAVKQQLAQEQDDQVIPLYEKDGKTVIGQFKSTNN